MTWGWAGVLVATMVAAGGALIVAAWILSRPVRLVDALAQLEEPRSATVTYADLIERLSASRMRLFQDQDLEILGMQRIEAVTSTVAVAAVAAAGTVLAAAALVGGVLPLGMMTFLAVVMFAVATVVVKVAGVRSAARKRREEARAAITVWLNFIALATAFHPIEGSVWIACHAGNTWTFEALRAALDEARLRKLRIWDALAALGNRWGIRELTDIGIALGHASTEGAKVRDALLAKSETLTSTAASAALARANQGTAKLQGPIALVTVSIFGLMLYPAIAQFQNIL